ncbi:hypothetical protein ACEYYB_00980 [Paracoccus sp. p4-l81]|uniref:hypothetical protein n=1 Tax=Paracoccus sp. p4-l81 TaxID=3342806 RepID=UPI0035BB960A
MRAAVIFGLGLLAALAACGPVPVDQAERQCLSDARLAQQPRGEVAVGINSSGNLASRVKVSVSSDYLMGRDPSQVYIDCVYRRSGQFPRTPLGAL